MRNQVLLVVILISAISSFAQETKDEFKSNGKPLFNVFWNYHVYLMEDAPKTSAFELKRAYLGYKYNFSETISVKVTIDVGSNDGGSAYTAYLKAAQLDWKAASVVKLSMGLIGMKQFKDQEKFWGYRYIFKSFQDQNGYGSSADLGINAEFILAKNLKANVLIANGEGYKKIQDDDGKQKFGGSLIFTPVKGLTTKVYADTQSVEDGDAVSSYSLFAGYKEDKWRLGAEYNKLNNAEKYSKPAEDKELDGLSFYGTYVISEKVEIFGRFDQLTSNDNWNTSKDGNQIIAGVQVAPVKGLKFALNYQGYYFNNDAINTNSFIYLNAQFKL